MKLFVMWDSTFHLPSRKHNLGNWFTLGLPGGGTRLTWAPSELPVAVAHLVQVKAQLKVMSQLTADWGKEGQSLPCTLVLLQVTSGGPKASPSWPPLGCWSCWGNKHLMDFFVSKPLLLWLNDGGCHGSKQHFYYHRWPFPLPGKWFWSSALVLILLFWGWLLPLAFEGGELGLVWRDR